MVAIDLKKERGYWLFLQQYLAEDTKWKDRVKPTVTIPASNRLETKNSPQQCERFENAVRAAREYMRLRTAPTLAETLDAHIRRLKEIDDRFVPVLRSDGKNVFTQMHAKQPVELTFRLLSTDPEMKVKFDDQLFGKGLPVSFNPGEFDVTGSPLFERIYTDGGTLQISLFKQAIIVLRAFNGEEKLSETPPLIGNFSGGRNEFAFKTSISNYPLKITIKHKEPEMVANMSIEYDFSPWEGKRLSEAKHFDSLVPFMAESSRSTHIDVVYYIDQVPINQIRLPTVASDDKSHDNIFVDWYRLLVVSKRFGIDPIPSRFGRTDVVNNKVVFDLITDKCHSGESDALRLELPGNRQEVETAIDHFGGNDKGIAFRVNHTFRICDQQITINDLLVEVDKVHLSNLSSLEKQLSDPGEGPFTAIVESTSDSTCFCRFADDVEDAPKHQEYVIIHRT